MVATGTTDATIAVTAAESESTSQSQSSDNAIVTATAAQSGVVSGSLATLDSDTNLLVGIIGGGVGAVAVVALCVVVAVVVCRRKPEGGESASKANNNSNAPARTGEYGPVQLTLLRKAAGGTGGALHQYDTMPEDAAPASEATVYAASPFTMSEVPSISNYALAPAVSEYTEAENVSSENRLSSVNAPSSSHSDIAV
jgi:hypothetical protein